MQSQSFSISLPKFCSALLFLTFPVFLSGCGGGGGNNCEFYTSSGGCVVGGTSQQLGPVVTAVSPSNGPAAGGTTITITGNHFTDNNGTPTVLFVAHANAAGQSYVTVTPKTSTNTSLTVVTPAGTGTVDIIVNGLLYSALTNADHFTYN